MKAKTQTIKKTIAFEGRIIPYCKIYLYDMKQEKNEAELLKIPPLRIPFLDETLIKDSEQELKNNINPHQNKKDIFKLLELDMVETVRSINESLENPLQNMGVESHRNNNHNPQEQINLFNTSAYEYDLSTTIATYKTGISTNYFPKNYTEISDSFLQGTDRTLQEEQRFKTPAIEEIKISFDFEEQKKDSESLSSEQIPLIQQESSDFFESQLLKITLRNMKIGEPPSNNESIVIETTNHQTDIGIENFDTCQEKLLIGNIMKSEQ